MSSTELPAYPPEKKADVILKHADSNDADEAFKIFQAGETIVLTPEDEKRLLRKIDLHILPLLCLVYGLNYLDKTSISYASIMGFKVWRIVTPHLQQRSKKVLTDFCRRTQTSKARDTRGSPRCSTLAISPSNGRRTASSSDCRSPNGLPSMSSCGV